MNNNYVIMDYKKKYNDALERAKKFIEENPLVQNLNTWIKETFPELAESEDERIRKYLIILLKHFCKGYRVPGLDFPVSYIEMLTWLEKQGTSYTKKDVDDAYVEGMAFAKDELEKQCNPTDEDMKELLRTEYEKGRADAITEMQVAWSEEDDEHYEACLNYFDTVKPYTVYYKDYIWLKSLKERIGGKL